MTQVALDPRPGAAPIPVAAAHAKTRSAYVASRAFDWAFILGAPLFGFVLAALLGFTHAGERRFWFQGERTSYVELALGALVNAHLVAVVFRSHANAGIFRRHPIRFVVVPALVLGLIVASDVVMLITTVVVIFWDVYHSSLQTFGFARIYDRRAGNDPRAGRRLDYLLNLLLYAGPIVAGASMMAHFGHLSDLDELGLGSFSAVPIFLERNQPRVAAILIAGGVAFLGYYVSAYARLARNGYRVAWPKVWLLGSTGLCSIVAWGLDPWGLAFFITNFFHAVQYLALVWWSEGDRLARMTRLKRIGPVAFLAIVMVYGAWAEIVTVDARWSWAIVQTVALMHFWYDGFVWSVSKRDV